MCVSIFGSTTKAPSENSCQYCQSSHSFVYVSQKTKRILIGEIKEKYEFSLVSVYTIFRVNEKQSVLPVKLHCRDIQIARKT